MDLYVESLCPYSRWLVATVFASIFENGLDESMEFRVFFAGNTREKEGKLVCQHGEQECYLNKVIGCAIARKSSAKEWFPLVNCIEIQGRLAAKNATLDECASKVGEHASFKGETLSLGGSRWAGACCLCYGRGR